MAECWSRLRQPDGWRWRDREPASGADPAIRRPPTAVRNATGRAGDAFRPTRERHFLLRSPAIKSRSHQQMPNRRDGPHPRKHPGSFAPSDDESRRTLRGHIVSLGADPVTLAGNPALGGRQDRRGAAADF